MAILMVVSAAIIAQLVNDPAEKDSAGDRDSILEKNSLEVFVSESRNYEDRLVFTYSPKNPDSKFDCYITYQLRENGNTLENINKEFYGNISTENPIVLEFPRKKDFTYELETAIKDKSGINMYKNNTEIGPSTIVTETSS
ncbi:hypothetical protein MSBR3_2256 [Methanosarcina barkeri 3]|uniref:Uncharacterized protein n=2 Tax=Methanosarcina barkeri TaxID=2208 RepID=A0A0E3WYU0_METBA|nr:hypothetical protein MSBR3_2256 [Methanosarcina barkeri 3]